MNLLVLMGTLKWSIRIYWDMLKAESGFNQPCEDYLEALFNSREKADMAWMAYDLSR